ncbi:VOC family protein [Amycolatopsis pithecellobii]|uniref:VOC family protein n=1 Tax=Amycolatopsis pithecellobii TaxID=664692 RepID=A0A6N7Z1M4_9PSEU|nr:VOC family protein [Amycolatopsis pithecellobii]MTD53590.1 VOC family protein [Amycolatopsis pithecellobii]
MSTRLAAVWIAAARPAELAGFWAALLDWQVIGDRLVRPPASDGCELDLVFVPGPGPKEVKNRIHLDLASGSRQDQRAKIERARVLGARKHDIGQGQVPWEVMIDPGGNEFCVLEPRPGYPSTEALAAIVVDALDPMALASEWMVRSGWRIGSQQQVIVGLRAPTGRGPWLEFLRTDEPKERPNRVRLALAGEPGAPGRVGRDSEGNEFVLLDQV